MKRTLGFAVLFTAAYLLIFSTPLKKEPVFKPAWVQNLTSPMKITAPRNSQSVGFRIGEVFGYAAPNGAIQYLDTTQFNVAMAGARFINYSSVSKDLIEKDSSGRIVLTVNSRGYPVFIDGRFFVINTNRTTLSEIDKQGAVLWTRDFGSLITAMDANPASVVIGLLDGSMLVVDTGGEIGFRYTPGGSKVPLVYGCTISADGSHIALVTGLDPQRFILLGRDKTGYRPRRIVDLGSDVRREVFLHIFSHVPYVYVELPGAIDFFSTKKALSGRISVPGRIAGMSAAENLIYAVSEVPSRESGGSKPGTTRGELTIFTPAGRVVMRGRLPSGPLFVKARADSLYLGAGRRLMRIDHGRE